ncbi:MAG: hypothetical protein MI749_16780, partial [Desulfovibrionales bacterium]|nr:hypothetical protein [Desulfovibrionales bacterium]
FVIIMISGILWLVFAFGFIAPRMFPQFWFERGITEFGMQAGVTAIGLLLLRLVDPLYKTKTATAFGLKQMVYEPFLGGGLITAMAPFFIISYGPWVALVASGITMLIFIGISTGAGWTRLKAERKFTEENQDQTAQHTEAGAPAYNQVNISKNTI